jgi:WD40 repeat protein
MLPLEGFVGRLHDVTFSPDGWLTVAVGDDATIHVWSGDGEKRTVTGAGSFRLVRFSQDGSRLATGDTKGRVTVRRTDTWEVVSRGEFSGVIGGLEFRGKTMSLGVGTYSPPSDEGRVHRRNLQIWDGRTTTSLRQDPPSDVGCRALSAATWHGRTTWAWLVDQRKVVIWETTRTDASSHVFPKECSAIVLSGRGCVVCGLRLDDLSN